MAIFANFDESQEYVSKYYTRRRTKAEKREFAIEVLLKSELRDLQERLKDNYEILRDSGDTVFKRSLFGKGAIDLEDLTLAPFDKIVDVAERNEEMELLIAKLSKYKDSKLLDAQQIKDHTGKDVGKMVYAYMKKLSRQEQKQLEAEYFDDSFSLVDLVSSQLI